MVLHGEGGGKKMIEGDTGEGDGKDEEYVLFDEEDERDEGRESSCLFFKACTYFLVTNAGEKDASCLFLSALACFW